MKVPALRAFFPCYFSGANNRTQILGRVQALSFIGFICIQCSHLAILPVAKFFSIAAVLGVWITSILLVFYLLHLIEKLYKVPWVKLEFAFCAIIALCFFLASTMVVILGETAFEVGAIFGFIAMVVYAIDAYRKYVAMRSSALAQGKRPITKETGSFTP